MIRSTIFTLLSIFVSLVLNSANTVSAQQIFFDDFSDGNDDGWKHEENFGYEGVWEISDGKYRISSRTQIAVGDLGAVESVASNVSNIGDGYLRLRITANTPGTSPAVFLQSLENLGRSYLFNGSSQDGSFGFWECHSDTDCTFLSVPSEQIPSFNAGDEWWLEAGKVDSTLSLKAWRVGTDEPNAPQQTYQLDDPFPIGTFGVAAWISTGWTSPQRVDASFDDISFRAVPEPSFPVGFMAIGMLVVMQRRRLFRRT
ncbi:MAG: hypothetical protein R3C28_04025 [Pirellulaceae bacterium]